MNSVSVIIPAFNDQAGVENCLEAIAKQTYPLEHIEVIVVDNGSKPPLSVTDNHVINPRVIQCTTPGSYAARNAGADIATSDVLAFIDADCVPDTAWLEEGVRCLANSRNKGIIGGEVGFFEPMKQTPTALYQLLTGFGQESNIREKGFTATANLLCAADQFKRVGTFDERLLSGGDREWCWRAAQLGLSVNYAPGAVVFTHPRRSIHSAARQTRRVTAGRMMLRNLGLAHIGESAVKKRRSPWQAVAFIFTHKKLSVWSRLQVLSVAIVIRTISATESARLAMGTRAEKR